MDYIIGISPLCLGETNEHKYSICIGKFVLEAVRMNRKAELPKLAGLSARRLKAKEICSRQHNTLPTEQTRLTHLKEKEKQWTCKKIYKRNRNENRISERENTRFVHTRRNK